MGKRALQRNSNSSNVLRINCNRHTNTMSTYVVTIILHLILLASFVNGQQKYKTVPFLKCSNQDSESSPYCVGYPSRCYEPSPERTQLSCDVFLQVTKVDDKPKFQLYIREPKYSPESEPPYDLATNYIYFSKSANLATRLREYHLSM